MIAIKLAIRNLLGAGLRTWLNVFILSLTYIAIIWFNGMLQGWNRDAQIDMVAWETGQGQFWQKNYDPFDFFSLEESHALPSPEMQKEIDNKAIVPILITQATIYPDGRMQTILLKGIEPSQTVLQLPTADLNVDIEEIPVIIGSRMAKNCKLKEGDLVTIRWRDVNGTFDAAEAKIVKVFHSNVPTVDFAQMWIPIQRLQAMKQLPNQATILVSAKDFGTKLQSPDWQFKSLDILMKSLADTIKAKSAGSSIMYIILLLLSMLAIFDTQVLSIFRRQKEIGTYIALGMTRGQVVRLFTVEGTMHAVLAALVGAVYGIPLLVYQATAGIPMPQGTDSYGLPIAEKIYPMYSLALIVSTILIVVITTAIVSYLPSTKISKMNPTEAIRGKIQ